MNAAVFGMALMMIVIGGATLLGGADMIGRERGWTMVIAGATVMTGGFVVFALGCVMASIGRLREAVLDGKVHARVAETAESETAAAAEEPALPAEESSASEPASPPPAAAVPAADRMLAATYSAGGIGYFMFSDGSIEAEMDIGRYRFPDMDALRVFIETGEGGVKVEDAPTRAS